MNNLTCTVCEAVVGLVAAEAKMANATTEVISIAVMHMCALIGGSIVAKECDFIVKNIDNIVSWISGGLTHKEVCKKLQLC